MQTYRLRGGLEGTIFSNYNWSIGYVYGVSDAEYKTQGDVNSTIWVRKPASLPAASMSHRAAIWPISSAPLTSADIKYLEYTDIDNSQLEEDYFIRQY
ncbi:MAG: hypothetical protein WDN69_08880 [Aliidongia sp.]